MDNRGVGDMARNTGKGYRIGSVDRRSQYHHEKNDTWYKRNREDGRFMDGKADEDPFKGVAREPDERWQHPEEETPVLDSNAGQDMPRP